MGMNSQVALVEVDLASMRLLRSDGCTVDTPADFLLQSGLLSELLACAGLEAASCHCVPVPEQALLLWMHQVCVQHATHDCVMDSDEKLPESGSVALSLPLQ